MDATPQKLCENATLRANQNPNSELHARERLQNTLNSAILLAVNNVIPSTDWTLKNCYHVSPGRGNPAIMANGRGRVTEPVSLSVDLNLFGDDP